MDGSGVLVTGTTDMGTRVVTAGRTVVGPAAPVEDPALDVVSGPLGAFVFVHGTTEGRPDGEGGGDCGAIGDDDAVPLAAGVVVGTAVKVVVAVVSGTNEVVA